MKGKEFRGLAEAVTCTYGDDPWFFLRELAQNSRDAGARSIRVSASRTPVGTETLTFADDGCGMTFAHARRFLFRLYASDKAGDREAAGRYGIGFWTILRFQPGEVLLQSRRGNKGWAVALDAELNIRRVPCELDCPGTMIVLTRPARFAAADAFAAQVENGLLTYCRYLRRNDRWGSMLPLWFAGKNLTQPMALPGPLSLSFHRGSVEGAVAMGEKPLVRLYARGLPVWQGAVLNQMSHLQADADVQADFAPGLAPVFLLNGNHLDVTFSRNLALENKALDQVREKAEAALHRLLESSLEKSFPRKWHQRLGDRLRGAAARRRRPGWHWLWLVPLALLPLEFLVVSRCFPARAVSVPSWFDPGSPALSYRGASVSAATSAVAAPFSYQPGKPAWFKLFAADVFDAHRGFVRGGDPGRLPLAEAPRCSEQDALTMRLQAGGGETFLPLAPGHAVRPGSLFLNGRPLGSLFATPQGEAIAVLPGKGGMLEYSSCPEDAPPELSSAELSHWTRLPARISLPAGLASEIRASRALPLAQKLAKARALVQRGFIFDAAPATARLYDRLPAGQDWLASVLEIARGDCDVLNGFHVLILRMLGVPARLVVGMIGDQGRVRPLLHAWSEYFDRGWKVVDAASFAEPEPAARGPALPRGPSPGGGFTLPASWSLPYLILLLFAAVTGSYFLFRKNDISRTPLPPAEQLKKALLQLIQHALLQPAAWGDGNPLWRHRLLPTAGGNAISILQARRLLRRKKLFMTANRNPLALAMAADGIVVLDLSGPLFAPLRNLLPGVIDSDLLCRLRPEPPEPGNGGGLLAAVNAQLRAGWRKTPPCLLAPGMSGIDLLHVSLPVPLRRPPFYFPQRFIAVNPVAASYLSSASLQRRHPALAVSHFLRRLQSERLLADLTAAVHLKRVARRFLRQPHG